MKATGIVRRIDELGRVVIPKEIRRTQRIRRGDPLEIFTTGDGEVIFKKYSPMGEVNTLAAQLAEVLSRQFALTAFVCDRDRILAVSGSGRRELTDRSISQPLEKLCKTEKVIRRTRACRKTKFRHALFSTDAADAQVGDRILAVSGSGRRELTDRSISQPLEKLMDARKPYQSPGNPEKTLLPCEGAPRVLLCAAPVLAGGDVTGAVGLLTEDRTACPEDAQCKAVAVAAAFLAKQMEE